MSISSTGLYGSATIVNSELFNDVEAIKEQVTTLSTSYFTTIQEHRDDISQNRFNRTDLSNNRITAIEQDPSSTHCDASHTLTHPPTHTPTHTNA
jgi:hypothetical protein